MREKKNSCFLLTWLEDFEKQKKYDLAMFVLRLLICLAPSVRSHAVRKMGSFWLRLSIDCVHELKSKELALKVAQKSIG